MNETNALVETDQNLSIQTSPMREEVDIQIATARRFPRSLKSFLQKTMTMATLDEETAASCFYSLKRGGKLIEGPSIRLAEIAASSWGNIRFSGRVVAEEHDCVVAVGTAHDLETNVVTSIEVRRRILDRDGKRFNSDMIVTTGNAATAIAMRNVIFKIIPKSYIDTIWAAAKKVAVGDATTLITRRQKALEHFQKMGVSKELVLQYLEKTGIEEIGLNEIEKLLGLIQALKDGETTIEKVFIQKPPVEDMTPKAKVEPKKATAKQEPTPVANIINSVLPAEEKVDLTAKIGAKSLGRILKDMETAAVTQQEIMDYLFSNFGLKSIKEVTEVQVEEVSKWILSQNSTN